MIKIKDFEMDANNLKITFNVEVSSGVKQIEVERTQFGAKYTDTYEFTEDWEDQEYDALEEFIDGCVALLMTW